MSDAPHSLQNAASGGFSWPQTEERVVASRMTTGRWVCRLCCTGKVMTFMRAPPFFSLPELLYAGHFLCSHVPQSVLDTVARLQFSIEIRG